MQRRPHRNQDRVVQASVQRSDPAHAQCGLDRQTVGLLYQEHGYGKGAHLVFPNVVKTEMQGQPLGWRLEHQLGQSRIPDLSLEIHRQIQVLQPVGNRNLQDVGRLGPLVFG